MGIIQTNPGYPGANSSASGGKVYAYNAINTGGLTVVAPANPQRQSIIFHNPGDVDIFICPAVAFISSTANSPTALIPNTAALGGCLTAYANGGTLTITGECQGSWSAFSKSSNTKPLTVIDSNL